MDNGLIDKFLNDCSVLSGGDNRYPITKVKSAMKKVEGTKMDMKQDKKMAKKVMKKGK